MKNKLNNIKNEFCNDLQENGFFLSDLVSKTNRLPKVVNSFLLASIICSSVVTPALSQEANINSSMNYEQIQVETPRAEIKLDMEKVAAKHASKAEEIDFEIINDIAFNDKSGAFILPGSKDVVFVFNKNNIELSSQDDVQELDSVVDKYFPAFQDADFALASFDASNVKYGGHDFNLVKLGYDSFSSHDENLSSKYPTFAKHEKLIETLHELGHAEHGMSTVTQELEGETLGNLEKLLVNESYATIYSLVAISIVDSKMSNNELIQLMKEHSQQRKDYSNNMDAGHGASYVIDNLVSSLERNPDNLDTLRNMDLSQAVLFSVSLTKDATLDLAKGTEMGSGSFLQGGRKSEIPAVEKDVNYYISNGKLSENYTLSGVESRTAIEKYDSAVKSIAEEMIEKNIDFNKARRIAKDENGDKSYLGAYDAFRILDMQYQLNESLNSYKIDINRADEFVGNAFNNAGITASKTYNYGYEAGIY
ncbi:hypothetical protein D051_0229 [Vibrio parahaemolyticus VPCR-2010]|uniref:hypothetical protein n=1 Tax=Vibrio parahaemolyticus TaxID=670 RepID=UPI00038E5800|nr:hypothetical protein D051_0229 [Vibrio parahaemolyticus VPCR-2010]